MVRHFFFWLLLVIVTPIFLTAFAHPARMSSWVRRDWIEAAAFLPPERLREDIDRGYRSMLRTIGEITRDFQYRNDDSGLYREKGDAMVGRSMADLPGTHPGCLVSSFVYQDQLLSRDVRELTVTGVQGWGRIFRERFERVAAQYPPKIAVDLGDLADMANTLVDGGIILSKLMRDKDVLPRQVLLYREFVRAVFLGA